MKNLKSLMAILIAGTCVLSSCSDDDASDKEVFSTLKPEEHKAKLEDEGVAFVQNMGAVANLEVYSVIEQFSTLMDNEEGEEVYSPLNVVLKQLTALPEGPQTAVNLKSFSEDEVNKMLSEEFKKQAGIRTWNAAKNDWDVEVSDKEITYNFTSKDAKAVISLTNFTYQLAKNQDAKGFTVELIKSLNVNIKLGEKELCAFTFTGEYYDNDTPKFLEEVFNLEGFKWQATLNLKDKTKFKASTSFDYNDKVIFASGLDIDGNIDYTAVKETMNGADEANLPLDQQIVDNANAYFQIGNIKTSAFIDVKGLIDGYKSFKEETTEEEIVKMVNDNAKFAVCYADKNEIIAKGEFYLTEEIDDWDQSVSKEPAMRMVFGDGSALDESTYFENGFGKMITEINTLVGKMNENYGTEIETNE